MVTRVHITHKWAPGDAVVATAAIRDLKLINPGVTVTVDSPFPEVHWHSPYSAPSGKAAGLVIKDLDYGPSLRQAEKGRAMHFTTCFHEQLQQLTGLNVKPLRAKPALFLTLTELETRPVSGRYWVMMAGGKADITTKLWPPTKYQALADYLRQRGIHCVQSGRRGDSGFHIQPQLNNVLDLVGWGGLRALFWLIYHADGVICPITLAMHVAAAFDKPCVVIAGGRESPAWEAYSNDYGGFPADCEPVRVPHKFLHSIGQLPCCQDSACWKAVVRKEQQKPSDCVNYAGSARTRLFARCMHDLAFEVVADAVLQYYADGTLPAISVDEPPKFIGPKDYR